MVMFVIAGGAAVWLGGDFFFKLHQYFLLSSSAPAKVSNWSVHEKNGKFTVEAGYHFEIPNRSIEGRYAFPKPVYPNPHLANDLVERWEDRSWEIWYNPKNPYQVSLQKAFPTKKVFQFGLSLAILIYFGFLKIYVKRVHDAEGESGKSPE
jgi:hypothetical protein